MGFRSTVGYNVTPHYQLLHSLDVIEIFTKLDAENRGENSSSNDPTNLSNGFSIMRGPSELLFFQLVVLMSRSKRYSNSFCAHRMFEISSHKVSSILSPSEPKIWTFFAKSSKSVLDDTVTERADIWGFGSTVGYNVTPHYRLLGSLHVIEIFKKLAAENRGENSAYNDPTNLSNRFSIMRGPSELLFFQLVVLVPRSKRYSNSF